MEKLLNLVTSIIVLRIYVYILLKCLVVVSSSALTNLVGYSCSTVLYLKFDEVQKIIFCIFQSNCIITDVLFT